MGFIRWNLRYIRVINSCNWSEFTGLLDEIVQLDKPFQKKRYIWNILRGKTFYKELSHYIIGKAQPILDFQLEDDDAQARMDLVERVIHEVVASEKSERAVKSFIWAITKKLPLLTVDTIPYMSMDRVRNILTKEAEVINDSALDPFIQTITDLRAQVEDLERLYESLSD